LPTGREFVAAQSHWFRVEDDVRNAAVCGPINVYCQVFVEDVLGAGAEPVVGDEPEDREQAAELPASHSTALRRARCPPRFGNSDIYGGNFTDEP
jgi:hypothetical protein